MTTIVREVYAKPCPFCGRSNIYTVRAPSTLWATVCWPDVDGCGVRTDYHFTSVSALTAWNRRVPEPVA